MTEEVNITPIHPLMNLAHLFATVAVTGLLIYGGLGIAASQLATRIGPKTEEKNRRGHHRFAARENGRI